MKKILIILTIISFTFNIGFAQEVYFTRNATLTINGGLDGERLELQTRELGVKLDYETAFLIIKFPISSLETGVDSLNRMLKRSFLEVVFDGKLGLEFVNTEEHPPMNFTTEGWLVIGNSRTLVKGKGELHHIGKSTEYACMLGLTMQLNLKELNLTTPIKGLNENFEAVITQALLQIDKN